jgi:FlaA1/EpsC-like NDP-sugar epimerase
MGEPVRVADLAMDLIRLSGLEPNADIEVEFTGVRPGEKLFEELFFHGAHVAPTIHPKILRARDAEADGYEPSDIEDLIAAARSNQPAGDLRRLIVALVPEYSGQLDTNEFPLPFPEPHASPIDAGVDAGDPVLDDAAEAASVLHDTRLARVRG